MSSTSSIRNGIAWIFAGNTGSQILGFAFGVVLARLLAPDVFGMLLTIQVFTGLAGFVSGAGMGQALVRAKEASRQDYDVVFTLQVLIGLAIYALFFSIAPWFADWYGNPLYAELLRVSALTFLLRPFNNIPASMIYRAQRYQAQAIFNVVSLIFSSLLSIALALNGYGVWSLVLSGVIGPLVTIPFMMLMARWRPRLSFDFVRAREIVRYGLLVTSNDLVNYLRNQASIFILSRTLAPASVGLYNKGESLARMPHSFITGSVYHVLFRSLAAEQDNPDRCRYLFYRSVALVGLYATPFYIGLAWLALPLIRGVYGEAWAPAAIPLAWLALAWPFWLMDNLSGAVLAAHSWLHRELPIQATALLLLVPAVWWGAESFGLAGVAGAVITVSVFSGLALHRLAIRCIGARWRDFWIALMPAAVLNGILAASLWVMDSALSGLPDLLHVLVAGGLGAAVYLASFLFLPLSPLRDEQARWKTKLRWINSR
ncbi:MAG: lipopolysaccharide biosynthesis protein [Thiobacillus sp.]|nr:lipopolysaccharide biosynthesis protein [Thiobacillus sp.]